MSKSKGKSFKQKLTTEELDFFNVVASKPFSEQATAFLNAYWHEVGTQAEHIFDVAWEVMKRTDMSFKGCEYIHLYDEGINLDFDAGLKFFESLCKYWDDEKNQYVDDSTFAPSKPQMLTAIVRKKELRDKVDVNFDGRVSFMEYLLYQYQDIEGVDPENFCKRAMAAGDEPPEVTAARNALADVMAQIRKYEARKAKLEKQALQTGVKGLKAKNLLAQLDASPLVEKLGVLLITAEAKVRIVIKKYGGKTYVKNDDGTKGEYQQQAQAGSRYWLKKDLDNKKSKYGKKKKK